MEVQHEEIWRDIEGYEGLYQEALMVESKAWTNQCFMAIVIM